MVYFLNGFDLFFYMMFLSNMTYKVYGCFEHSPQILHFFFTMLCVDMPSHHKDFLAIIVKKNAIYAFFCLLHTATSQTGVIKTKARTKKGFKDLRFIRLQRVLVTSLERVIYQVVLMIL